MNFKKIFLLFFVSLLLVGLSYASEVSNDTGMADMSKSEVGSDEVVQNNNMIINEKNNVLTDNNDRNIVKQYSTAVKSEMNYDVDDFNTFHNALIGGEYDTVTLNINSNFNLKNNTEINSSIKNLVINGNGKTINGVRKYQFFNTSSCININLTNIRLINNFEFEGGAIYNTGNLTIYNSTFEKNYDTTYGGAIYNTYSLTLNNCIFNDITGMEHGGAIYNMRNLTANNCIFNDSDSLFGGSIYNRGIADLNNCIFNNSRAEVGEAIINYNILNMTNTLVTKCSTVDSAVSNSGTLRIRNSRFENNGERYSSTFTGGAISNGGNLIIDNSTFKNNSAENAGAIYSGGNLTITNSIFKDNWVVDDYSSFENGGAIYTSGNITKIKNCIFINNTAKYGGAIYTMGPGKVNLTGNIFSENIADTEGSAIYSSLTTQYDYSNGTFTRVKIKNTGSNLTINNNIFIENKANSTNSVITIKGSSIQSNNTYYQHSKFNSTIYSEAKSSRITNNIFTIIPDTEITINKMSNTQYNDYATIKGTLKTFHGFKLSKQTVTVKVNNVNIASAETNENGTFTYKIRTKILGKNNITVTYNGNNYLKSSSGNTTFNTVAGTTTITVPVYKTKQYKQKVTITGKLKDTTGTTLKNASVKVKVNSKTYSVKTDSKGVYTVKITANKIGTNNVTVSYEGNKYYKAITKKTTFKTVARTTTMTIPTYKTKRYNQKVIITGKLKDTTGTTLKNATVKIKVNSKTYTVKTNNKGVYRKEIGATTIGQNNIIVTYNGNKYYKKITKKTTFKVLR